MLSIYLFQKKREDDAAAFAKAAEEEQVSHYAIFRNKFLHKIFTNN